MDTTIIDPQLVMDMVQKRTWLPLGALGVGAVVRLLKEDVRIFPNIPSRWRVWVCFVLGQVAGALEAVIAGKTYKEAVVWGLTQSVIAILGQNTVVDSLFGGKEIPVPGLMKVLPDVPPGPALKKEAEVAVEVAGDETTPVKKSSDEPQN